MKKLLYLLLLLPLFVRAQPVPPPATQTEVNAGLNKFKYVTPFTLQGWTVGGATGAVTVAQLNSSSNAIVAIIVANDTTTSNGVFTTETTRNAAVSNALVTLLVANDTTTSNGAIAFTMTASNNIITTETTRNAAVSNALVTLLVANDTTTSNGLVTVLVANDTTTSNGVVAFTMTASNNVWTAGNTLNLGVSNAVISYLLGVAVTNGDTRTTWINNLNVGTDFRVTNNAYVSGVSFVGGAFNVGGQATFTNGLVSLSQVFIQQDNLTVGGLGGTLNLYGGFSTDSTNAIHTQTEDFAPANGDYILTEDVSAGRLKKVSIGNLPTGGAATTPAGNSGAIQFNQAGAFAGTNKFYYDRTNNSVIITTTDQTNVQRGKIVFTNDVSGDRLEVGQFGISGKNYINFNLGANNAYWGETYLYLDTSKLYPVIGSNIVDLGTWSVPFRTNHATDLQAKRSINLGESSTAYTSWRLTNSVNTTNVFWRSITNPVAGQREMYHSVTAAGGVNHIVVTNVTIPTNWSVDPVSGHLLAAVGNTYDIGSSASRGRTNWFNVEDLSAALALRDPSSINSGRGTLFAHPSDWKVTNQFNWAITNPVAGQALKISSASISGGLATIIITNDFPSTTTASGMFLRDTNMFFDGGITTLYTNTFTANIGGVTNIMPTNILAGSKVRLEFQVQPGVTVGFPTITTAQWGGYAPFFSTNIGEYNVVEVSVPSSGVTNARHWSIGFELKVGSFFEAITNFVDRSITIQSTRRFTNYADANITINAATEVSANYTNAVAGNRSITLSTPVIGASGSLSLVSDGSARTLAILSPHATVTWMSTNDTATATNILTSASKRSLFAWRVGMATDGVTTNIACWVKNQAP